MMNGDSTPVGGPGFVVEPRFGRAIAIDDALSFLFAIGALNLRLLALLGRNDVAACDDLQTDATQAAILEHAERLLKRFQMDNAFFEQAPFELYRKSVGLAEGALEECVLLDGAVLARVAAGMRDTAAAWNKLLPHLVLDGQLDQLLLSVSAVREAAEAAEALQLTRPLEETRAICCWLNWQTDVTSLRQHAERLGLDPVRLDATIQTLSGALAFRRHQTRPQDRPLDYSGLRSRLCSRPKSVDGLVYSADASRLADLLMATKDRFGITRVTDITGLDVIGVPNYSVVRPSSEIMITVSSGKGMTHTEALASGLAESAESFFAERARETRNRLIRSPFSTDGQGGVRFVDPRTLVLPSRFAKEFRPEREIEWIEGTDLVGGDKVWVPLEAVAMSRFERVYTHFVTTNGLGVGVTMEDAILHALCEVVERDAYKCAWFAVQLAGLRPEAVGINLIDNDSLPDRLKAVIDRVASQAGVTTHLIDCGLDVGVPTVWAVFMQPTNASDLTDHPLERAVATAVGFGTHPNPEVAATRALLECIQVRVCGIQGARESLTKEGRIMPRSTDHRVFGPDNNKIVSWEAAGEDEFEEVALRCRRFLEFVLNPSAKKISLADIAGEKNHDVADDIVFVARQLGRAGLGEVISVDLSQEGTGLSAVRVLVPGLEPPQYDRTGWRCHRFVCEPESWRALRLTSRSW